MDFGRHRSAAPWVRLVVGAALAGIIALVMPLAALAADVRTGDDITIGPDATVTDDVYAFGNNVLIQGTVHGDVLAAGSNVTISGHVTGSVMAAGSSVVVSGPVDGNVRLAGNTVTVAAPVGADVLLAGSVAAINSPGSVGRDVLAAGNALNVQAPVARNVKASGNTLTLGSTIGGAVDANATNLVFGSGAVIQGPVSYVSTQDATVRPGAQLSHPLQRTSPPARTTSPWEIGGFDTLGWLRGFVGLALFGVIAALVFPRGVTSAASTVERHWLASLGLGFAMLVGLPVLALLVLVIGVFVGGWWIGLFALATYAVLLVLGYVTFAEWVGQAVLRVSRLAAHPAAALLLGLLVLGVATLIPVLGGLLTFAATVFGVGAMTLSGWRAYYARAASPVQASLADVRVPALSTAA